MRIEELGREHRGAFLEFIADLRTHDPATLAAWFDRPWDELGFNRYLVECAAERRDWRPKAKQISTTRYLVIDDDGIAGFGLLRFPLTAEVEATGGNAIFVVPPARRGRGLGALVLNRTLLEAARAGLARARLTCPAADARARRCIEANGGLDADLTGDRAAYWIRLR